MTTTIRVPTGQIERADALTEDLSRDPAITALLGGKVSRSAVLRLALHRGLEELEIKHRAKEDRDEER